MATTGSATSTAPLRCGGEVEGLKTHISTALGGLLGRALNDLLDGGPSPGIDQSKPDLQTSCLSAPSSSGSAAAVRPGHVYDTELAERVRRLISKPCSVGVALLRAKAEADGECDSQPYICFYCKGRFEQQSTLNRHMGRAHRTEMVCSEQRRAESEDDRDLELKPPGPEYSWESVSWRVTSSVGVASTVPSTAATASALGTSAVPPRTAARPHGRKLSVGKDVPVAEGYLASGTRPDPSARGGEAQGLKTHMSAALGGLLVRALGSQPVGAANPGSSVPDRRGPVHDAELARQLRRKRFSKPCPRGPPRVRSTRNVDSLSDVQPYACFYCESRFEQQSALNRHARHEHGGETAWKRAHPERGPGDAPGGDDSSRVCHGRAGRRQSAERRAMAALRELDAPWRGCRAGCGARLPAAASAVGVEFLADPLGTSRCNDLVKEEPVLNCELDAAEGTIDAFRSGPLPAWDPVIIKREVHEDPEEISEFSGSIKEDPELDLGVDANDSSYRPSQWSCRRGEACCTAAT